VNITDADITELRNNSQQVQNWPMAALCRKALNGDEAARERIAGIITDARNAELMGEYLALRGTYERAATDYQGALDEMTRARSVRDTAFAALADFKARQGDAGPDDRLCCQRYGRVHPREFAVPGCRWYEPEASRA